MSARTIRYVVTQPRVVLPALIGIALMVMGLPKLVGFILLTVSAVRATRLLNYDDLDDRLRMRDQKRAHGVHRRLSDAEREEIFALDAYCAELRRTGADPTLVEQTMAEGWNIIRRGTQSDQGEALRRFRTQLPRPDAATVVDADFDSPELRARLEREMHLLRASRREVELTAAS